MVAIAPGSAVQPNAKAATAPGTMSMEKFLETVEHRAYRFALYELRDREAALDAVQDGMLKLVEHYRHKPANEWPALFFTILRHRIQDARRWRVVERLRRVFQSVDSGEDGELTPRAPASDAPDAHATTIRRRAALEDALRDLPPRQRQVVLLREWQELSIKETATALGCTEGTVKQHHFRALQALRRRVPEEWKHDI